MSLDDRKVWLSGVRHLKKQDPKLGLLVEKVGRFDFDRSGAEGHYEFLVASIVYQQIAGNAARAILGRFKGLYNGSYPTPRQYLNTRRSAVRSQHFTSGDNKRPRRKDRTKIKRVKSEDTAPFNDN